VRRKEGGGMRKMTVCALPLAVVSMAGCRTIKGAGRDIEAASDTTREKIHDIVH
jgi:predicted small secreted protein